MQWATGGSRHLAAGTSSPAAVESKSAAQLKDSRKKELKSIGKLVDEVERDYQFKLGYLTIEALITSVDVTILPPEAYRADRRAMTFAGNMQTIWNATLPHAIRAFAFGRAAFEKVYTHDDAASLILLQSLNFLPFENTEMKIDDLGAFAGIKLKGHAKDPITLEPNESWWMALDPTAIEPHGKSRYLGAAQEVLRSRQRLWQLMRVWYNRFSVGEGVGRFPEPEGAEKQDPAEHPRQKMINVLEAAESGAVILLSSEQYVNADGTPNGKYKYDFTPSAGLRDGSPLDTRQTRLDAAALRSIGVPERSVTQDADTGSYAMAEAHMQVLFATCDGVLDQIAASFEKYVIQKLEGMNWPQGSQPGVKLEWTSLRQQYAEQKAAAAAPAPAPGFGLANRQLAAAAKDSPPDPGNYDQIATKAAKEAAEIFAELQAELSKPGARRDLLDESSEHWGRL